MTIEWKDFMFQPDLYRISNDGQVYSKIKNKLLKGGINNTGYRYFYLKLTDSPSYRKGASKWFFAHKLVAEHFIPNHERLPEVNHKDLNKLNNNISNLEWCTHAYNVQHSYDNGRIVPRGEQHWNYGKRRTKRTRNKMSLAKIGELHPKFKGWYCIGSDKYASARLAQAATGIPLNTIIAHSRAKKNGWTFIPCT